MSILTHTRWKVGQLFSLEYSNCACVGAMNVEVERKLGFSGDAGYGLYLMWFDDTLLYVGSFCGASSVVKDRWAKHLSTITLRFKDVVLVSLRKPTLSFLLSDEGEGHIEKHLNLQKERLKQNYSALMTNHRLSTDVYNAALKISSTSPRAHLKHLLGDGVNTSLQRVSVANQYWDQFRSLTPADISERFAFDYFRINPDATGSDLGCWLYDQELKGESKGAKKKYVQENIERPLITCLQPPANGTQKEYQPAVDDAFHKDALKVFDEIKSHVLSK